MTNRAAGRRSSRTASNLPPPPSFRRLRPHADGASAGTRGLAAHPAWQRMAPRRRVSPRPEWSPTEEGGWAVNTYTHLGASRPMARKDDRLTEYTDNDVTDDVMIETTLADQVAFYKIPRRFGTVPVDDIPLGYDKNQQYYKVYPRVALPFQKASRVTFGHPELAPNRLFWGDNLHVMRMLPSNSIDLIYIDPPFFSNANYNIIFGDQNEVRSFVDIWEGGMPSYLIWLNARLLEMKRLLKPTGSIYVHLDHHASHYVKVEMDKIFGYDNFKNEIVWKRFSSHNDGSRYGRITDTILFYTKSDDYTWNESYTPYTDEYIKENFRDEDANGRYTHRALTAESLSGGGYKYEYYGHNRVWKRSLKSMKELEKKNLIHFPKKKGGVPRYKIYLKDAKGLPLQNIWTDIPSAQGGERVGYPTQKPEALVERILGSSTNKNDVVADFYVGGGTTPIVAQKLGRRWIACDQSRVAVAITQGRLETLYESKHGGQHTLGSVPDISVEYWGTYEIPALETLSHDEFKAFVVSAYGGRPTSGSYHHIHGFKRDTPLYVGPVVQTKRVTKHDVVEFADEITTSKGKRRGTMLAWGYAPSARIAAEKLKNLTNSKIDLVSISLISIDSIEFRKHVTSLHNDYGSLLTFIHPPDVIVKIKRIKPMTYNFDASDSIALNRDAKIVNIQWDFDFQGRFTPTQKFGFGRTTDSKPLSDVEYTFKAIGQRYIACRVQDSLGGEKIHAECIEVR